jgi:hypothetical protein
MSRYMWRNKTRTQRNGHDMENLERYHLLQPKELRLTESERDSAVSTSREPVRLLCGTPTMKHQWSVPEAKRRHQWSVPEEKTISWWMDYPEISVVQPREEFETRWSRSNRYFNEAFLTNEFGHACDVCERLWFRKDIKSPTTNHMAVLRTEFDDPNFAEFSVCNTCRRSLNSPLTKTHGFPQESIEYFMFQMLGAYSEAIRLIFPNMNPTPRLRFYCAATSTRTSCKISRL